MITRRRLVIAIAMSVGLGAMSIAITQRASACDTVIYEDGSGVRYCGNQEMGTYPEGTFPWDCETMGNRICGDIDNAHIDEEN